MLQVDGKPFFPMGFYILSSFESVFPADQPYVWLTGRLCPDYYQPVLDRLTDSHFNCFIDYGSMMGGIGQARGVLDAGQARGLKAIFSVKDLMPGAHWQAYTQNLPWKDLRTTAHHVVRKLRDHPALISWYINDEVFRPDLWEGAVNVFRDVRAADPWHRRTLSPTTTRASGPTARFATPSAPTPARSVTTSGWRRAVGAKPARTPAPTSPSGP